MKTKFPTANYMRKKYKLNYYEKNDNEDFESLLRYVRKKLLKSAKLGKFEVVIDCRKFKTGVVFDVMNYLESLGYIVRVRKSILCFINEFSVKY